MKSEDILRRLRIEVSGAVQGVGFRPFVFRIAGETGVTGWVCNSPQGAVIEAGEAAMRAAVIGISLAVLASGCSFLGGGSGAASEDTVAVRAIRLRSTASQT